MAEKDGGQGPLAPFPPPPLFLWSQFTEEKEIRLKNLRDAYASKSSEAITAASIVPDMPDDLACLQPPQPPEAERWRVYGQTYSLSDQLPTLEEQGVTRLGAAIPSASAEKDAHASKVFELKKLSKSLLLNFLELAGILAMNPSDAANKLADLQTIFFNMHQHINEWRPHQTREALITLLQSQLERTRNETRALHEATDSVRRTLVGLAKVEDPIEGSASVGDGADKSRATNVTPAKTMALESTERIKESQMWKALDETFG